LETGATKEPRLESKAEAVGGLLDQGEVHWNLVAAAVPHLV
jgi:hypothetical protein